VGGGVGVTPAGDGTRLLYDGQRHPFLRLRDGTHPLAVGPVKPRPLIQARQIRPAAPVGARNPGSRPADRLAGQPGRRQPTRRSGRDPEAPDPTPPPGQNRGSRAEATIHSLPADYERLGGCRVSGRRSADYPFWWLVFRFLRPPRTQGSIRTSYPVFT